MKNQGDVEIIKQLFDNHLSFLSDNGYRFRLNGQIDIADEHEAEYNRVLVLRDRLMKLVS